MANKVKEAVSKWTNSPVIIWISTVAFAMLVVSSGLFVEDYATSLQGYKLYPTNKYFSWIVYLAAAVPQLGQVGFAYAYLTDENKWGLPIALIFHLMDVGTDVLYKTTGSDSPSLLAAFVESETFFTLGSEIMLSVSFALLLATLPDSRKQIIVFLNRMQGSPSQRRPRQFDRQRTDLRSRPGQIE